MNFILLVFSQSPTATKKQKLEVTGTETDITSQSTKLSEVAKDEDALDSAGTRECISHSEHTSGQGKVLNINLSLTHCFNVH